MSYDLTKVGPVREDVQVIVSGEREEKWHGPYSLVLIDSRNVYHVWDGDGHFLFTNAKLYEPPVKRPMAHPEIFKAIREGAVVRDKASNLPHNYWSRLCVPGAHEICYNYTDTEADVWEEMEVEGE